MNALRKIVENPYLNIFVGCLLLYSGLSESWYEFHRLGEFQVGAHHGIVLFSVMYILKSIPDVFEGIEYIAQVGERAGAD